MLFFRSTLLFNVLQTFKRLNMHYYGDEDFNRWRELGEAAEYIGLFCRKWGRIQVHQYKEKYGTVRVYCNLVCESLHDLIFPGYYQVRSPYRLWVFPLLRPFRFIILKWQIFIYRLSYSRAVKKWPEIKDEIICCADFKEFLSNI